MQWIWLTTILLMLNTDPPRPDHIIRGKQQTSFFLITWVGALTSHRSVRQSSPGTADRSRCPGRRAPPGRCTRRAGTAGSPSTPAGSGRSSGPPPPPGTGTGLSPGRTAPTGRRAGRTHTLTTASRGGLTLFECLSERVSPSVLLDWDHQLKTLY